MRGRIYRQPDKLEPVFNTTMSESTIQLVSELLSSVSSVICIMNERREIVFTNERLIEQYGLDLERDLPALRFGEIMQCVSLEQPGSTCGSTDRCKYCGANYTFDDFWKERRTVVNECRLIRTIGGHAQQIDLEITATPFRLDREYMMISLADITELKRREILERIFFHDIINMAGSLSSVIDLMKDPENRDDDSLLEIAGSLSTQIIEEIKGQQQLFKAEKGELEVNPVEIGMADFLNEVASKVRYCQEAFEREIDIEDRTGNMHFVTDRVLMNRVVFNMAKNALEAIGRGERVQITATAGAGTVRIEVHNFSYIEDDVRSQLFQRSYSTKGKNRGFGTYSMKLLGERYLGGKVGFFSEKESGTTFFIEIPLSALTSN